MEKEVWKDIPSYEGYYQVSNLGNVKSLDRKIKHSKKGYCLLKGKLRKLSKMNNGYYSICLIKKSNQKTFYVHQLVAMAFLNHMPSEYSKVVDHIDNNPLNNNVDNLQVISQRENSVKDKKESSSRYTGVFWNSTNNKWTSRISIKYKRIHLINSISEIECKKYYELAVKNAHLFNGDKNEFKKLLENERS
jgi:hypothetical protein